MRMGSSHVWDYGNESPVEYLSDSELEGSSSDEDMSELAASCSQNPEIAATTYTCFLHWCELITYVQNRLKVDVTPIFRPNRD